MRKFTATENKKKPRTGYAKLPSSMMIPAYVLAVLVFAAAYAYIYLPQYLGSLSTTYPQLNTFEYIIDNVIAISGLIIAYYIYRAGNRFYIAANHKNMYAMLYNSLITNAIYLQITKVVSLIADLFGTFDFIFDKSTYLVSQVVIDSGNIFRRLVNGQTNLYVFAAIVGFIVLVIMFVL